MDKNRFMIVLILQMATFKLLMMEKTSRHPSIWNVTQYLSGKLKHPQYTIHNRNITKPAGDLHGNKSVYNFRTVLRAYEMEYKNITNNDGQIQLPLSDTITNNLNQKINDTNQKYVTRNFSMNQNNFNNRSLSLRKLTRSLYDRSKRQNCGGGDCENWNNDLINIGGDSLPNHVDETRSFGVLTESPFLSQLQTYINNKTDKPSITDNLNSLTNNIYNSYIVYNKKICDNSSIYANQSCLMSRSYNRYDLVRKTELIPKNYRKTKTRNSSSHTNRRKSTRKRVQNLSNDRNNGKGKNRWIDHPSLTDKYDNKRSQNKRKSNRAGSRKKHRRKSHNRQDMDDGQDDDGGQDDSQDDDGQDDGGQDDGQDGNGQDGNGLDGNGLDGNGQDGNGQDGNGQDDGQTDQDFKVSYPANTYPFGVDYQYMKRDSSRYEDKRALSRLQDMYYCSKYCHCCSKGKKTVTLKYNDYGKLGKLLSIMKYFGYNSGYDFFYGKENGASQRSDSNNPMTYLKDYYDKHYGTSMNMDADDESFVFHNPEKGDPEGMSDCKEVCTCCEENKKEKLKIQMEEKQKIEEIRRKKLQGLTGIIRYLIFSDDDGKYDFVDDPMKEMKSGGRSYSGSYYMPSHQNAYEVGNVQDTKSIDESVYKQSYGNSDQAPDQPYDPNASVDDSSGHVSYDLHHDHKHDVEHHHHPKYIVFDCSKCCRFCKKPKEQDQPVRRRRRRRRRRKKKLGLLDYLKSLVSGEPPDSDDGGDSTAGGDESGIGSVSVAGTAGTQYSYDQVNLGGQSLTVPGASSPSNSSTCCFNSTMLTPAILIVTIAIIIISGFSSTNLVVIVIIPLVLFGFIVIFIFLLMQSLIPIYLIPIFIIVLVVILIPIILLVILFFLLLPLFLAPVFFPFILRLPGAAPGSVSSIANINCVRLANSTISCSMGSTTPAPQMYVNDATEAVDYVNFTTFETTTDVSLADFDTVDDSTQVPLIEGERQLKIPNSLYWKINTALGKDHCLERAGCHLATYTNSYGYYNQYIFRILENLSLSIDESKFTAYKDAYQIGSLNITNHEKCATLYYCKRLDKLKTSIRK